MYYDMDVLQGLTGGSVLKNMPGNARYIDSILGLGTALEKEMPNYCCILPWEIPWLKEPGRLQFMGLQKSWT